MTDDPQGDPPNLAEAAPAIKVAGVRAPAHVRGTTDWFKREWLHLIEYAKAVDGFGAAVLKFQKLVELGVNADDQVRSALHTAGVIEYARPFGGNSPGTDQGKFIFSKSVIKEHPNYNDDVHQQLIHLHDKLIAHSDRDYADGRLTRTMLTANITMDGRTELCEVFLRVHLMTQTVHTLDDMGLANRYLVQLAAAEEAARAALITRMEQFALAGREFPDQIKAAAPPEAKPIAFTQRFKLPPGGQVRTATDVLNPNALLNKPPLALGSNGYDYRGFSTRLDLAANIVHRDDEGTETPVFNLEISPRSSTDTGGEFKSSNLEVAMDAVKSKSERAIEQEANQMAERLNNRNRDKSIRYKATKTCSGWAVEIQEQRSYWRHRGFTG